MYTYRHASCVGAKYFIKGIDKAQSNSVLHLEWCKDLDEAESLISDMKLDPNFSDLKSVPIEYIPTVDECFAYIGQIAFSSGPSRSIGSGCLVPIQYAGNIDTYRMHNLVGSVLASVYGATHYDVSWFDSHHLNVYVRIYKAEAYGACEVDLSMLIEERVIRV